MANLTPSPGWTDVPQLEINTIAIAGPGGTMNMQSQALLNRTESLNPDSAESEPTSLDGTEKWSFKKAGVWVRAKLANIAAYVVGIYTLTLYAGPGASARTLLSILLDGGINVKGFDTVQHAADAASGKVLFFPPGSSYVVDNGFDLVGDGSIIIGYGATIIYNATTSTAHHCIRIFGNNISVLGIHIKSPVGLIRDDTGFGISAGRVETAKTGLVIRDVIIENVGSAGIWVSNMQDVSIESSTIRGCKADGIHASDGCSKIVIANNTFVDNEDDNIAIVNDTTGAPYVSSFVISGNYIDAAGVTVGGSGIALIGASSGTISGNTIENTFAGGIQTYVWTDAAVKTDKVLISGNKLTNTGRGTGLIGGLGILLQQNLSVTIQGNYFSNIAYNASATANGAIWITDGENVTIHGNTFDAISSDGIVLTQGGSASLALAISGNTFSFISRTPVLIGPSATLALADVNGNSFLGTSGTNDIDMNNATAIFTVSGNTCKKVVSVSGSASSMVSREEVENFTPTVTAQAGTITTASGAIFYQRRGRMMLVSGAVSITTNGTGSGAVILSLPFSVSSGVLSGRENALTGAQLNAIPSGATLQIRKYDNTYPGASGASITFSGILQLS